LQQCAVLNTFLSDRQWETIEQSLMTGRHLMHSQQ